MEVLSNHGQLLPIPSQNKRFVKPWIKMKTIISYQVGMFRAIKNDVLGTIYIQKLATRCVVVGTSQIEARIRKIVTSRPCLVNYIAIHGA